MKKILILKDNPLKTNIVKEKYIFDFKFAYNFKFIYYINYFSKFI